MPLPKTYGCCVALRSAHHLTLPKGSRVVYALAEQSRCRLRWLGPVEVSGPAARKRLAKKLNELAERRKLPVAVALVAKPCERCGDDRVMRRSKMQCHPKTNLVTETVVVARKDCRIQPEFEQIRGTGYRLKPIEEWDRTRIVKRIPLPKESPVAVQLKLALRFCNDEARGHIQAALQLLATKRKRKGTHDAQEQQERQGQQRQEPQGPEIAPTREARWWCRV